MIYDVEVNGRTRRIEIQRHGQSFVVSLDGRRQSADVTVVNGVWSLILSDVEDGPAEAGPHDSKRAGLDDSKRAGPTGVGAGVSRPRRSYEIAIVERPGGELTVHVNGRLVSATVASGRGAWARRGHDPASGGKGPQRIMAPMPGKVVKVLVKPGDAVAARQAVIVVEAMKMENELRAPKAGTVTDVRVTEGTSVEAGAVLVVIE